MLPFPSCMCNVKGNGCSGIYPKMSHSRKKPANIHSNKFHKLTVCNCAHVFMMAKYRTAMGIENKNGRLNVGFCIILQIFLWTNFLKIIEHI